jgi:hypothetical protein
MQSSITSTPAGPNTRPAVEYDSDQSDGSENSRRNRPPHQRSASVATATSQSRKASMSNWASAAVPSFLRREKSGNFESLNGNDGADEDKPIMQSKNSDSAPTLTRSRSGKAAAPPPPRSRAQSSLSEPYSSSKHNSPKLPPRSLPGLEKESGSKVMRALHSFEGTHDELTIEAGDEIIVLSEPSDTWWMGECKGKKGLFPVNYTEEMPKRPPLPARPSGLSTMARTGHSQPTSPVQELPMFRARSNSTGLGRNQSPSFDDEPFGDHHSALTPIAHSPDYRQVQHSDVDDHEEEHRLFNPSGSKGDSGAKNGVGSSPGNVVRQLTRSFSGKKGPPPPPPTRKPTSASGHRLTSSASNSANASPFIRPTTPKWESSPKAKNDRALSDSKSPFDEAYGEADNHSLNSFSISNKCAHCQCDDFQQSLFKQDGYCNSCFHSHV